MFVELPTDVTQFIHDSVGRGMFQSESDVVTAALRIMRDRESRLAALRSEIQPALDRLDRGEGIELDDDSLRPFFDDIIASGNKRLGIKDDEA